MKTFKLFLTFLLVCIPAMACSGDDTTGSLTVGTVWNYPASVTWHSEPDYVDANDTSAIDFRNFEDYVVMITSEEENAEVQKALFRAGFVWRFGGNSVLYYNEIPFAIYITTDGHLTTAISTIGESGWWALVVKYIYNGESKPITAEQIINDPFSLKGAKAKLTTINIGGREVSEATILEALRAYFRD